MTSAAFETLQPNDANPYSAWLDAMDPIKALMTWDTVTLIAHGTSGPNGEVRRATRGAAIGSRKRAIERFPWVNADGRPIQVHLKLKSKRYSETYGFMHASYFTYQVFRTEIQA